VPPGFEGAPRHVLACAFVGRSAAERQRGRALLAARRCLGGALVLFEEALFPRFDHEAVDCSAAFCHCCRFLSRGCEGGDALVECAVLGWCLLRRCLFFFLQNFGAGAAPAWGGVRRRALLAVIARLLCALDALDESFHLLVVTLGCGWRCAFCRPRDHVPFLSLKRVTVSCP